MTTDTPKAAPFVARGAQGYDAFMGRWSERLASPFLDFAGVSPGERVVDVGCGTGSLTFAVAGRVNIAAVSAIDYEEQFVEALRQRNTDPRIEAQQGDACALPFAAGQFDRALSMLVLHFVADPQRAAAEMRRVVRPRGVAAAAVWDNYGGLPAHRLFWDTLSAIEPAAQPKRVARPTTQPGELRNIFADAGFIEITETMLTIRMDFAGFDDYWFPQVHGQGTTAELLARLPQHSQERVQSAVRAGYLDNRPDGPRSFASVAWAVRGVVPD
jgi:ubiquinone/menaquinone biosynthesis C-methylase UbiE